MRSGELRHKVTLQSKAITRDVTGGEVITWSDESAVRASVEPLRGREFFSAQEVQSEINIRFCIRYVAEITTAWRVLWETRPYDIIEIIDVDGLHIEQQIMARTQING